jgi:hypothetical protein
MDSTIERYKTATVGEGLDHPMTKEVVIGLMATIYRDAFYVSRMLQFPKADRTTERYFQISGEAPFEVIDRSYEAAQKLWKDRHTIGEVINDPQFWS